MISRHENGRLPQGIHPATWAEVEERFGFNPRRRLMLSNLRMALTHFAEVGCSTVYLAGSFVTTKANPKDVDVCWSMEGVDLDRLHPMFLDFVVGRQMTLALFGAEFFPAEAEEGDSGDLFLDFFQTTRTGEPVGVVALDLETL